MILPLLQLDLFEISVYYDEILPNTKLGRCVLYSFRTLHSIKFSR